MDFSVSPITDGFGRVVDFEVHHDGRLGCADRATPASPGAPAGLRRSGGIADARRILKERTRRAKLFPHMREPSWLILVDLYVNHERDISISSACFASFAPYVTALRHIGELERSGLIFRADDLHDRRRHYLRLSDDAHERLTAYFGEPV